MMKLKKIAMICALLVPFGAHAQGISETSVVGKEMSVGTEDRQITPENVSEMVNDAQTTANEIRILTAPEEVQIVKLGERRVVSDEKLEEAMRVELENIEELRMAIQINAILMDVLDAQQIGIPEVIGAKFTGEKKIEIYAFAAQGE